MESTQSRLIKGLVAGMVAGLVAAAAKSIAERYYHPSMGTEAQKPATLARKIAGNALTGGGRGPRPIQWGYGALTGAAYGALAEFYPVATAQDGAGFGLALLTLTHEDKPLLSGGDVIGSEGYKERTAQAATHVLYGFVAERVRSIVRGIL